MMSTAMSREKKIYHLSSSGSLLRRFVSRSCRKSAHLALQYVYENTATGSPLRHALLHECTGYLLSGAYSENPKQFPHEMLIDLVIHVQYSNAMPLHAGISMRP